MENVTNVHISVRELQISYPRGFWVLLPGPGAANTVKIACLAPLVALR
jgi:hypothetical protein